MVLQTALITGANTMAAPSKGHDRTAGIAVAMNKLTETARSDSALNVTGMVITPQTANRRSSDRAQRPLREETKTSPENAGRTTVRQLDAGRTTVRVLTLNVHEGSSARSARQPAEPLTCTCARITATVAGQERNEAVSTSTGTVLQENTHARSAAKSGIIRACVSTDREKTASRRAQHSPNTETIR